MKVRFNIIGYGHIGKRHADIISRHPEAGLYGICDTANVEAPKGVPLYTHLETMLGECKPDVLCVCTPNGLHSPHCLKALSKGIHVICEKPMALSAGDCRQMSRVAEDNDAHLFCVLQNRYSPQIKWLKALIDEHRLGEIYQVQINCFWNRDERYYADEDGSRHPWHGSLELDGGPLFTQFSHFVDILVWLFDEVKVEGARFANFNHRDLIDFEDAGMFGFTWAGGGLGSLHYSVAVWDANQESSITLIGSKGSIRIGGQYMNHVEYCHIQDYEMPELSPAGDVNDYGEYKGSANNHFFVIRNMIDTIGGRAEPDFDVEDACRGIHLIEEVYRLRAL